MKHEHTGHVKMNEAPSQSEQDNQGLPALLWILVSASNGAAL